MNALVSVARAARLDKNAPLLLLLLSGVALGGARELTLLSLSLALVVLIASAGFMTHLNVVSDRELDSDKKPELWRWLAEDWRLAQQVMGLELVAALAGATWLLFCGHLLTAVSLLAFLVLTTLYSFNFLMPRAPFATRLKTTVWGHALVALGGYVALWVAGLGLARTSVPAVWGLIFAAVLSDYAVFLAESAIDDVEERRQGLHSLAARLGRARVSRLALSLAAVALVPTLFAEGPLGHAFWPAVALRCLGIALLRGPDDERRRRVIPDALFWLARAYTLLALMWIASQ